MNRSSIAVRPNLKKTCPGFNSQLPEIYSEEKTIDIPEVNQWRWLKESGQRLENVDQAHLVASKYYKKAFNDLKYF